MSHATHISADVAGRGAQAFGVFDALVQGAFDGLERARVEELDAVSELVAELGRARRAAVAAQAQAAAAEAEAARLRGELHSCGGALAHERARADRAERTVWEVAAWNRARKAASAAA